MLSRSLSSEPLSASYFHGFPVRPACCLAPSQRSFPQAISTVSHPSSMLSTVSSPSSMLSRSLPAKLSACYLHLHGFLSVQHAVSLPSSEALHKLFPRFLSVQHAVSLLPAKLSQAICTVSSPSSMLSCPLPGKLSASPPACGIAPSQRSSPQVIVRFRMPPGEALRKIFARFPIRSACCLAPSQRSSPQAISTISSPSSMLYPFSQRSSRKVFALFRLRPACCLGPSRRSSPQALFARFPLRPACCLAPSQRSSPQAICMVSSSSSMLSRSLPAKLSANYFHGFLSVQHAVSLPPNEAFPKLFPLYPILPACCLAPSQRSSPQAISTVSSLSSMLSRSLPAKLSASSFHGIPSVQYVVSLPSSEALPELFPRFPLRPARCLAPFQRSSPKAICTVSCPSSMLSCSLPAKLSPSYLHDFLSVQHAVSLPPSKALPSCFHGFLSVQHAVSLLPAKLLQAIYIVSSPSSVLSRSLPAKLSASYFHGFLSVQHAVSLPPSEALRKLYLHGFLSVQHAVSVPPGEALRKLFPRFPFRPACCLAPSQRSFPQTLVSHPSSMLSRFLPAKGLTVSSPSSMLSRSLQAKLSASYLHGFLSVQHAVSLPPSVALRKRFPRFCLRPTCLIASSYKASRKLFPRFPVRPACCIVPLPAKLSASYLHGFLSVQLVLSCSLPEKLSARYLHGFLSSSMLSRSLPAKLSARYLHGFLSVQHAVSLPPSEAFPKLFQRFPLRPACCLAPSQLSASYLHGFLSVQHAVSLPPREAFRKLFPWLPIRPACCLAPSQRSSPQAISTVPVSLPPSEAPRKRYFHGFRPSSMLSRSLPRKLSTSYLPRFPLCPACCLCNLFASPSFLPSFLPPFLPPSLPPSLPSFLPSFLPPCFWEKTPHDGWGIPVVSPPFFWTISHLTSIFVIVKQTRNAFQDRGLIVICHVRLFVGEQSLFGRLRDVAPRAIES